MAKASPKKKYTHGRGLSRFSRRPCGEKMGLSTSRIQAVVGLPSYVILRDLPNSTCHGDVTGTTTRFRIWHDAGLAGAVSVVHSMTYWSVHAKMSCRTGLHPVRAGCKPALRYPTLIDRRTTTRLAQTGNAPMADSRFRSAPPQGLTTRCLLARQASSD
jgi:hypothetical protein